jgi:MFS transporter, putative metabolite:H+ symporter
MKTPLTSYQIKLLLFLSVATFFEGYDIFALTQILPELRREWTLSESASGLLVGLSNIGTIAAFLLVRQADRWGRKGVLSVTIVGYTVCSLLSGLAPNPWIFGAVQVVAKFFLIAEWATAMVYAAEDFPADRRGLVMGLTQSMASLGSIACAGLAPLLLKTDLGWRMVYFVGVIPLILVAIGRRSLQESSRFHAEDHRADRLLAIWGTEWRTRVLQLSLIWGLTYLCTQTAISFWKEFAVAERGMDNGAVGRAITLAAVGSMPFVFASGKLIDMVGRRVGAVVIFTVAAGGVLGAYTLEDPVALNISLGAAIFGVSAVLPVLNAWSTELFPTELRANGYAWSNNLLGRIGYVIGPVAVGWGAESFGWGPAVAATAFGPVAALALILLWMPETRGKELEETSLLR